jgi:hypothetical protein
MGSIRLIFNLYDEIGSYPKEGAARKSLDDVLKSINLVQSGKI